MMKLISNREISTGLRIMFSQQTSFFCIILMCLKLVLIKLCRVRITDYYIFPGQVYPVSKNKQEGNIIIII